MRQQPHDRPFGEGLSEPAPTPEKPKAKRGRPRKVKPEPVALADALPEIVAVKANFDAQPLTDGSDAAAKSEQPGKHVIAVTARRAGGEPLPRMLDGKRANPPTPEGFTEAVAFNNAGIRVTKSLDGNGVAKTVGLQFVNDRVPERHEKDILEAIHEPDDAARERVKFTWNGENRQWERPSDGNPGANLLDTKRLAEELSEARQAGRGR